jgi:hypothetical protein
MGYVVGKVVQGLHVRFQLGDALAQTLLPILPVGGYGRPVPIGFAGSGPAFGYRLRCVAMAHS